MRSRTLLVTAGTIAFAAACTRTVIVRQPVPDRDGSRPPPTTYDPNRPGPSTAVTLGIPPGQLPQPGECRIWIPGTPPGRQPRPRSRSCYGVERFAPAGSWIVYRPTRDRRYVHVRVVDERRPGVIVIVRIFEAEGGRFVMDTRPEDEPENERPQQRPPDVRPREEPPPPPPARMLGIPVAFLPDPGECRLWVPRTPAGLQPHRASRDCAGIMRTAPAGLWVIYRPRIDRRYVYVREVDDRRPGVIAIVRIFEIETGRFVMDTRPESEPRDDANEPPPPLPPEYRPPPPEVRPPPRQEPPRDSQPPQNRPPENRPPIGRPEIMPPPPPQQPPPAQPPEQRPPEQRPPENKPPEQPGRPAGEATLRIPPGHLPPPGECRVWLPGRPAGLQRSRASADCDAVTRSAPAGSWVVYRPTSDRKVVHVRVVDPARAGIVIRIDVYDADSQRYLREEKP